MSSRFTWLAVITLCVGGCGGGGGGGDAAPTGSNPPTDPNPPLNAAAVAGLNLPESFSVLSAAEAGAAGGVSKPRAPGAKGFASTLAIGTGAHKALNDADTDYSTDEAHVYVHDQSMEGLSVINEIVCYINQTGAAQMVNRGPYVALVNEDRCQQGRNGGANGATGESTAGDAAEFSRWIIDSERTDNDSPQLVRLWVPDAEGEGLGEQSILVEIRVEDGVSEAEPFGRFALNFRGVVDGTALGLGDVEVETMRGTLATVDNAAGRPQFRFISMGGTALQSAPPMDFGYENAANVRLDDAAGASGLALTRRDESWIRQGPGGEEQGVRHESFAIAYNSARFLSSRDDDGDALADEEVCRARDEFDVRVWRYNLYHREDAEFRGRPVEAGQRVELNSGFPFSYDSAGDGVANAYGWLGYHGIWTESGGIPADGQTIHRFDYDTDATVDYSVRVAPGRLVRRVANHELLSAFVGDTFQFWGPHPSLETPGQWLIAVDQNLDFQIISALEWGDNGPLFLDAIDHDGDPQTSAVSVAATLLPVHNEVLWMWSEALGGNVVYTHDASLAAQDRRIVFFAQEFVTASDAALFPAGTTDAALYCYDRCLKGGLSQADVAAAQGPWDLYHSYQGTALRYTLSMEDGKVFVTDDTNGGLVAATELALASIGQPWGISTGEMLTDLVADESRPWTVNDQPMSYRWETGPNAWNVMITATDAIGQTVVFDRPLQVPYIHSSANDANGSDEFQDRRFLLQYGGPGNLGGFPWVQDGDSDRWHAAVTLADGVVLADNSNSFVVRALEKEQSMRDVDLADCDGLDADAAYGDPSLALPGVDDIGAVSFTLADRPQVDGAPAVIEGQVQGESP